MDQTIAVRLADPRDADAIRDLTLAAYAKWVPLIGREPRPMRVDYAAAVSVHRFDLLEVDGALAALIETTPEGDALLIVNVAVHPSMQGRGLGVQLLRHAEALAAAAGLTAMRLYTNQRMQANIRLYELFGYTVEREETVEVGVVVHMVKPLSGSA